MNHVHKDHNYLLSEIIKLEVNVDVGATVLMMVYVIIIGVEELMCLITLMEYVSLFHLGIFIMKVIF